MIKNNTYYNGKPYLKLEKFPHYTGQSKLNKIHIDLGFIKLVSRVSSKIYNEKVLKEMADEQGVRLRGSVYNEKEGTFKYVQYKEGLMPVYVDPYDKYLGIDEVFMCFKYNMKIVNHGLAEVYDKAQKLIGYYGFSHRGGQTFKIGDVIFDENWQMDEFHKDFRKFKKILNKSKYASRLEEVIPYKERGSVLIETLDQAKEAAIKISDELS